MIWLLCKYRSSFIFPSQKNDHATIILKRNINNSLNCILTIITMIQYLQMSLT